MVLAIPRAMPWAVALSARITNLKENAKCFLVVYAIDSNTHHTTNGSCE
jgi:hypothetical protein